MEKFNKINILKKFYFDNKSRISSSLIKVLNIGVNFIVYFLLISRLGLSKAGLIYACLNLNIIILVIGQVGFKFSLVKYISQFFIKNKLNEIKNLIIYSTNIQVCLSFLISLALVIGISNLNQILFGEIDFKVELFLFILSIPFLMLKDNNAFIIQGLGFASLALIINTLILPIFLILGILFLPFKTTIDFSLIHLISSFLLFIISNKIRVYIWLKKSKKNLSKKIEKISFEKFSFIKFSLNAWKITVLSVFIPRINELLVSVLASPVDVAIFSTCLRIAMLLYIPTIGSNQVISSLIASSHKLNNFDEIRKIAQKSTHFIIIMSLPIFIFIILFPEIVLNIFSNELISSANILRMLAIASLIKIIFGPNEIILSMCGFEKYIFKSLLFSFFISISSCIYLLPKAGLYGACISLILGNFCNSLFLRIKFNNFINIHKSKII